MPTLHSSFKEKIAHLRLQIKHLEDGTDPEYLHRVKQMREVYEKRCFVAEVFKQYELEAATEEYDREKAQAIQQFEAKGLELKECLLNDLQDKKKAYDNYRHNLDLASGKTRFSILSHRSISPSSHSQLSTPLSPRTW